MVAVAGWRKYIGDVLRRALERRKGNEGRRWNRETGIFICQEQLKKKTDCSILTIIYYIHFTHQEKIVFSLHRRVDLSGGKSPCNAAQTTSS